MKKRTFYFIRHGETTWNRLNRFQGHTDVPLSDNGRAQAHQRGKELLDFGIEAIFCSPLSRAKETAQALNKDLKVRLFVDYELKEGGCPQTASEIYCDLGLGLPDFSHASVVISESREEFISRTVRAAERALRATIKPPLLVAHGGTYWALCNHLGQTPQRIPNCTLVRFEPLDEGCIVTLAESPPEHLDLVCETC